jgi:hypothetical protein
MENHRKKYRMNLETADWQSQYLNPVSNLPVAKEDTMIQNHATVVASQDRQSVVVEV